MDRSQAIDFVHKLLRLLLERKGSDLFITAGFPPAIKVNGRVTPVSETPLTPAHTQEIASAVMNDKQMAQFDAHKEANFAISLPGEARFRTSAFVQRDSVGLVMRPIPTVIPSFEELHLPPILRDIAMTKLGLVLFVGGTGTGKSTSLAAMVDYRNEHDYGHIITIEDPIEFLHRHKHCIVTQREVGVDTESYAEALKNTLRQAPDVILIGEIRERETMEHGIAFAETGHLCLSTLHANNTNQAMDRIINFFPEDRRPQLLMDLSFNLKAVVSQRLIPRQDGQGRIPAVEVMINTPLMSDLLLKGKFHEIKDLMARSNELGMQTFDQSLFNLFEAGHISFEQALKNADSINDLRLRIKLESQRAKREDIFKVAERFTLQEDPE
ncbi:MAG: PilT/PilU family type 4a pilus ATPase [Gammaproteobacteria bacterium]|nr:MAG: PilT/PilU family type 4a pilus ATPase [Gammaproteobacteria bacterium]